MSKAYISIGSNINPRRNVLKAMHLLSELQHITKVSTVYRTRPELNKKQSYFYNCVAEIKTTLSPEELKYDLLRKIEKQLGRKRTKDKFASRAIDLDLIAYGEPKLKIKNMNLPDPEILQRPYLAAGLSELKERIKPQNRGGSYSNLPPNRMRPLSGYTKLLRKELKL